MTSHTPVRPTADDEADGNHASEQRTGSADVVPNAAPGGDGAYDTGRAHVVAPDASADIETEYHDASAADGSATAAPQAPAVTDDIQDSAATEIAQYLPDWIRKMSSQAAVAWLAGIGFIIALVAGALNSRREID